MVAVVIIAIIAVIAIWLVRRRRRAGKRALELQVAVIGFEASGKTVYISSMFNELRVPDASGVFLDTSPENAGKLLALYNTMPFSLS
jgi:type II secretory pathway pseudopilin PulG